MVNLPSVGYSHAIVPEKLKVKFINLRFAEYFNHKNTTIEFMPNKL